MIGRLGTAGTGSSSGLKELQYEQKVMMNGSAASMRFCELLENRNRFPYAVMADENGEIAYNGVIFQGDEKTNTLCLGDISNPDEVLTIPLEKGGSLKVNRENIDQLAKAVGMFSPQDVNRIMRAIAQDGKVKKTLQEIEEETSGIGLAKNE